MGVSVTTSVEALKLTVAATTLLDGPSNCTVLALTVMGSTAPVKVTETPEPVATEVAPFAGDTALTVGAWKPPCCVPETGGVAGASAAKIAKVESLVPEESATVRETREGPAELGVKINDAP